MIKVMGLEGIQTLTLINNIREGRENILILLTETEHEHNYRKNKNYDHYNQLLFTYDNLYI